MPRASKWRAVIIVVGKRLADDVLLGGEQRRGRSWP
jgi:hypothetical protein